MESYKCKRCKIEEKNLPTHQYVKFCEIRYDLCTPCWSIFNKWLYGNALKEPKPNPGKQYATGLITGREPSGSLSTGREPIKL